MSLSYTHDAPEIPAHVPKELVKFFDFRHELGDRPQEVIGALADGPRIFYSPVHHTILDKGSWVLTRAEDIRSVMQDPENFLSGGNTGRSDTAGGPLIPLELDTPVHEKFRAIMNRLFAPARMRAMDEAMRRHAASFIDVLAPQGECDFMVDFAQKFPAAVFVELMGLPPSEIPQFLAWEGKSFSADPAAREEAGTAIAAYLRELIALRRRKPAEDLMTFAVQAEIDGRLLSDEEVLGMTYQLFLAGLDTVASSLGWQFRYLAESAGVQADLRANPDLLPNAVEEFLRVFSVATNTRIAAKDLEVAGVKIRKGDVLTCSTISTNMDPAEFSEPSRVDVTRAAVRHAGFGFGPHRCIGSHLARREILIAHEEWVRRIPPYRMKPDARLSIHGGGAIGLDTLPLLWG